MRSPQKDRLFLSRAEVLAAIRMDFEQYEPQVSLYLDLIPLIFGSGAICMDDPRQGGLWFKVAAGEKLRRISAEDLGLRLLRALDANPIVLQQLVKIATLVFEAPARIGVDPKTGHRGLWIETGMEAFTCRQCGRCCLSLDYHSELTSQDVERWRRKGRNDILKWVRKIPNQGGQPAYRIWVHPQRNSLAVVCPFLEALSGQDRHICRIHSVKPTICRQYPGSRKHGIITGCIGFS
jgi:Fe-S-cluster containining protein